LLTLNPQPLPARDEQLEVGAGGEEVGEPSACLHDLLEIVEDAEQPLVGDVIGKPVFRTDNLRSRLEDELGVA
jgi:hypothetical protein